MSNSTTIPLSEPIKLGDLTVTEITLTPKLKYRRILDELGITIDFKSQQLEIRRVGSLVSAVVQESSGLSQEAADQISLADNLKIVEALLDFLGFSLPIGATEPDS